MPVYRLYLLLLWILAGFHTARSQAPRLVLPVGHILGVRGAVFSPDYRLVLSRDRFELPYLWDARTGYLLATLPGHNSRISQAEFSWDGTRILTVGEDGAAMLWETRTASPLLKISGKDEAVSCAALNLKGNLLVTAMEDKSIVVRDSKTGKRLLVWGKKELPEAASSVRFNQKGDKISAVVYDSRYYWDARTGRLLAKKKYNEEAEKMLVAERHVPDDGFLDDEGPQWKFPPYKKNPGLKLSYQWEANEITVMDTVKEKRVSLLTGHTHLTRLLYFSPTGDTLFAEPDDRNYATAWSTATFQLSKTKLFGGITRPNHHRGDPNGHIFFSNDRRLALVGEEKDFTIWDNRSRSRLPHFRWNKNLPNKVAYAVFSDDNSRVLTVVYGDTYSAVVWDLATAQVISRLSYNKNELVSHACFSPDNKTAALFGKDGEIALYTLPQPNPVARIKTGMGNSIYDIIAGDISRDNSKIFFIDSWSNFKVFDIATGHEIYSLREPGNYIRAAVFTPDHKGMLLSTSGSLVKRIDFATRNTRYHFFPVDSTEYFAQTPEGFYQASPAAARLLHYVTRDLNVITFEQLDVKYNRPDKVLEAIGSTDTALIRSYRRAWNKRTQRLGIDTSAFREGYSVPVLEIVNQEQLAYDQNETLLTLRIKGSDSLYRLDRMNIWVNESPVYGQRGISLRSRQQQSIDTSLRIRLSKGENRIEASVQNINGTESFRMPVYINYTAPVAQKEITRFIGIGIDKFRQSEYDLRYSSKDIRDLAARLREKYRGDIIIDTLFNENVTSENIKALRQQLRQTGVDDKVIIAYSGHGMLNKDFDYYLSTYAVNFNKPEENGLPYEELENLLDSIPARKKLLLIDACHSGEVDKEELVSINAASDSLQLVKGLKPVGYKQEGQLGLKNSFELMQNLFVNVSKSTGATVISAAAGTQFALERNDLQNGVFTFSILEAMKKYPSLKISELKKIVGERVEQLTNGLQKPTSRSEMVSVDWNLW